MTKLASIRSKTENTLTNNLDSKVGFMRLLGRSFYVFRFLNQFVSHKLHRVGYHMLGSKR